MSPLTCAITRLWMPANTRTIGDGRPYLVDVSHFASEWLWLGDAATALESELGVDTYVSTLNTDPWTARFDAPEE